MSTIEGVLCIQDNVRKEKSMKAILVDDEQLPLQHLQIMLEQKIGGIQVIGTFTNPIQAIEMTHKLRPDVVFLDINMPQINGLEIGEQLQNADPSPEIVFVTGYDKYAVDAFELCALDYIMKPVQLKRLEKTVERLREKINIAQTTEQQATPLVSIQCFNHLQFHMSGQEPQEIKWRTNKVRELFAYLFHHRNKTVDKDTLLELLWPDYDLSKGMPQLYTAIYLIRQTLKRSGIKTVTINKGNLETGYKLTVESSLIDVDEWEKRLAQLAPPARDNIADYEQTLAMYSGDYFGEYDYLWAEYERERLRRLWLQLAKKMNHFYQEKGMLAEAIQVNERIQLLHPLDEDCYFSLMQLYDAMNDPASVEEQYELLATRWEQELDSAVNEDISNWFQAWKAKPYA